MPVCKFFLSETGCFRGDKCFYQHIRPSGEERFALHDDVDFSTDVNDLLPKLSITDNDPTRPSPFQDVYTPVTKVRCRYFDNGSCKNGDACRFLHDTTEAAGNSGASTCSRTEPDQIDHNATFGQEVEKTVAEPRKPIDSNTRELSGALVRFGSGGQVLSIKPAAASHVRVQMCNVSCTWYQPSKTAVLQFKSTQSMNEAMERLKKATVLHRALQCTTSIDKSIRPWLLIIRIGNLHVSTEERMLRGICKEFKPMKVIFGACSYSSSDEEIGQAIQRLFASKGSLESWTIFTDVKVCAVLIFRSRGLNMRLRVLVSFPSIHRKVWMHLGD